MIVLIYILISNVWISSQLHQYLFSIIIIIIIAIRVLSSVSYFLIT